MAQMWDGMQLDAVIGATSDVQPPEEEILGQKVCSVTSCGPATGLTGFIPPSSTPMLGPSCAPSHSP
jgi:hypothetical protein